MHDAFRVKLNKPVLAGQAILDIPKVHMQRLWYTAIVPLFKDCNLRLGMTDTDSLIYSVDLLEAELHRLSALYHSRRVARYERL